MMQTDQTGKVVKLQAFVVLVNKMRVAQRRYFRERTQSALVDSKKLEQEVDEQLKGFFLASAEPEKKLAEQPDLFGGKA